MVILPMEFSAAAGIVLTALWLAQAEELLAARGGHAHRFIGRIVIDGGAVDSPAWRIGHAGRLFQQHTFPRSARLKDGVRPRQTPSKLKTKSSVAAVAAFA